jgi:hypothetical protein
MAEALEGRTLLSAALSWIDGPSHLATAPDHAVWYANGSTLTRRATDGTLATFTVPSYNGGTRPTLSDLAFTSDGTAWFASPHAYPGGRHLESLSPQGAFNSALFSFGNLWDVAVDGHDRVWFAANENTLGYFQPAGNLFDVHVFTVPGLAAFSDITTGPDGNIWFAGDAGGGGGTGGLVGVADGGGILKTISLDARLSDLAAVNGAIYVGGNDAFYRVTPAGTVTKIAAPGVTALELTPGADGDLLFIDYRSPRNPIALLTATGAVEHFTIPGQNGEKVTSLALAADGRILYTAVTNAGSPLVGAIGGSQAPLATAAELYPRVNIAFTGVVASFDDPLGALPTQFTATIDWGDGSTTAGTVTRNAQGLYEVVGSHEYDSPAWKTIEVHVADATRAFDIFSAAYALPASSAGSAVTVSSNAVGITSGASLFHSGTTVSGVIGTFVDAVPAGIAAGQVFYSAVIHWGDGMSSPGTIAPLNGAYQVTGAYTYSDAGDFPITLSVQKYTLNMPGIFTQVLTDFAFRTTGNVTANAALVVRVNGSSSSVDRIVLNGYTAGLPSGWASSGTIDVPLGDVVFEVTHAPQPVGRVHIGTSGIDTSGLHGPGGPGGPGQVGPGPDPDGPGTPDTSHHRPATLPPTPASPALPSTVQTGTAGTGIAIAPVIPGSTPAAPRLANPGYTLLPPAPDRSAQDPGSFRGELAVGAREWVDEIPDEPGDGTASYASDDSARPTVAPRQAAAIPLPAPLPPPSAATAPGEEVTAVIATGVEIKAGRIDEEREPRARTEDVGTPLEVKPLSAAETPVVAVGITRWWKAAAVLGAGALVQAWYWRRVLRARQRWS